MNLGCVPRRGVAWELRIRAFGQFEVIRHGEPLRFSGKAPKKPLKEAARTAQGDRRHTSLAKALNLYVSEIMSGDEGIPTVLGCRNRVDAAVIKAIRPMAQALEKCRDRAGAARWYERALEISPAAEEFYRLLLRTYGHLVL